MVHLLSERPRQFEAREVVGYPGGHKWRRSGLGEQLCPFPLSHRIPGTAAAIRCPVASRRLGLWLLLPDDQMIERWEGLTRHDDGSLVPMGDVDGSCPGAPPS